MSKMAIVNGSVRSKMPTWAVLFSGNRGIVIIVPSMSPPLPQKPISRSDLKNLRLSTAFVTAPSKIKLEQKRLNRAKMSLKKVP